MRCDCEKSESSSDHRNNVHNRLWYRAGLLANSSPRRRHRGLDELRHLLVRRVLSESLRPAVDLLRGRPIVGSRRRLRRLRDDGGQWSMQQ
jgi:ribonuclease PH